jgi:hypothetical protein
MSPQQLHGLMEWGDAYAADPENAKFVQGYLPVDAASPSPLLPVSDVLSVFTIDFTKKFTFGTGDTTAQVDRPNFSYPGAIYAISAGARSTSGTALTAGMQLDSFDYLLERSNGLSPITEQVLASAVLGTGARPRYFGANALMIPGSGQVFKQTVTPHQAQLEVSIVFRTLLIVGPANFSGAPG